jgi:hypothetical protein
MTEEESKPKPIAATTEKITDFVTDKVDDAKYELEARQRKFDISGDKSKLDRKTAKVENWFEKKKDEAKEGFTKITGIQLDNDDEKKEDGFDCAGCGCFSST